MAARQGFEPRYAAPEAAVLPLDDVPTLLYSSKFNGLRVVHWGFNMNRRIRLAAAVFSYASAAWAVDWNALRPQGYVSDFAGVLDAASKTQLEAYCAAVEQATGAHIALATIPSLRREPIEDVTHALFRAWDLDQRPQKNAVLWLVAVENRRDSMEAGRGLATVFTDSAESAILREARPALARQQYAEALMATADEIGTRIAAAQHKRISAQLPRRAHRSLADSVPWLLAAGALLLSFWLFRVLAHAPRKVHAAGGFGGDGDGGW